MPPSDLLEALSSRIARLEARHDADDTRGQLADLRARVDLLSAGVGRLEARLWVALAGAGGVGGLAGWGAQLAAGSP